MLDFGGGISRSWQKTEPKPPNISTYPKITVDFLEIYLAFAHGIAACGCFQKYGYPKMDGENNGNPY